MQNPQYTISSDSVTYNMDTEIATFDTPSYIWNDQDEFLTARRGSYNAKEDLYTFTDSSYIMTKTQGRHDRVPANRTGRGIAKQHPDCRPGAKSHGFRRLRPILGR